MTTSPSPGAPLEARSRSETTEQVQNRKVARYVGRADYQGRKVLLPETASRRAEVSPVIVYQLQVQTTASFFHEKDSFRELLSVPERSSGMLRSLFRLAICGFGLQQAHFRHASLGLSKSRHISAVTSMRLADRRQRRHCVFVQVLRRRSFCWLAVERCCVVGV